MEGISKRVIDSLFRLHQVCLEVEKRVFLKSYLDLVWQLGEYALHFSGGDDSEKIFWESLNQASLIYVDLKKLQPREPRKRNFRWAVDYLIIEAACSKAGIPMLSPKELEKATCNFHLFYVVF
eukprot:jgi/Galph1/5699/GphlegSOOS_G4353.1